MQNTTIAKFGFTLCLFLPSLLTPARAQAVVDYAVQVNARVEADPPQIVLSWVPAPDATGYSIYRKGKSESAWGEPVELAASALAYTDREVSPGQAYEYRVLRTAAKYHANGYIYAGLEVPLTEGRGKVVLIVEDTHAPALVAELAQFQQDLVGDGWTVLRHDVPRMSVPAANLDPAFWAARSNEVTHVKRLIKTDYLAGGDTVRAVFLLGHVPVPYSGALAPDGHPDHFGAWPADVYYGDMEGTWTDFATTTSAANDPRNHNQPGDGKFDQTYTPGNVALQVGRVDMANLSAFPLAEVELLRQYLKKNHQFRHKLITPRSRALIRDNLGELGGWTPAANGWRNFAPLVGAENIAAGHWLTDLNRADHLWAYGCGPGTYFRAAGVVDSWHFLVYDTRAVFTMLFGSYFGDWDSENNLLRAQLGTATYTLTSAWAGRPNWFFHHMALGETIGFSARLSQNNTGLYPGNKLINGVQFNFPDDPNQVTNEVHAALMGDPTLRLHPMAPPRDLVAVTNDFGGVDLSWEASPDADLGYHVYRAFVPSGPYARVNDLMITGTAYTDPSVSEPYYMVRAVRLESTGSGSYVNASQGVFAEVPLPPPVFEENTWAGRTARTWTINDALGTAGADPGWDRFEVDGILQISATPGDRFSLVMVSFNPEGAAGPPAHFDFDSPYSWPILTASEGIAGFDPEKIQLVTTGFRGDLAGGVFSLGLNEDETEMHLIFSPNRPPVTEPAYYTRSWDTLLRIEIADLLARFTSDPDGDARRLVHVGSSTNGTSISIDGGFLLLAASENLSETFQYWIEDVRDYRPGDTVRLGEGMFTVDPVPAAVRFSAYHAIEVVWQTQPGARYQVQTRPDSDAEWVDHGEPITGTGETLTLFERTTDSTKFFRIISLK